MVNLHSRAEAEATSESTLLSTPTKAGKAPPPARAVTTGYCDYIVYRVRARVAKEVVAVLLETNTTEHPKFTHAVAQVTSLVPLP